MSPIGVEVGDGVERSHQGWDLMTTAGFVILIVVVVVVFTVSIIVVSATTCGTKNLRY